MYLYYKMHFVVKLHNIKYVRKKVKTTSVHVAFYVTQLAQCVNTFTLIHSLFICVADRRKLEALLIGMLATSSGHIMTLQPAF